MPFPPLPKEYELDVKLTQESLISLAQANFKALFTYLQRLRELSFDETLTNVQEGAVIVQEIVISAFQDSSTIDFDYTADVLTANVKDLSILTQHLGANAVTESKIADLAVSTAKIQLLAITTALLNDLAVTVDKLADLSVSTAKLIDQAVTYSKIQNISAASRILLRGSAAGAGVVQEGTVGSSLSITGTVLDTAIQLGPTGTYTPTLTGVANVAASTAYSCHYYRVGDVVTVGGRIDIDPTLAATLTQLGISLPIASNFANLNECAGAANSPGSVSLSAAIYADAANNRAEIGYISTADLANQAFLFTFTYRVI